MNEVDAPADATTRADAPIWPWLPASLDATDQTQPIGDFRHVFRIGQRWLLVPAGMPGEVYPPLHCARLPFTHPWCLGLASFRGDLAPVYDLGAIVNERTPEPGRYFLLLGRRDTCAALGIDEVNGITVPPDTPITCPPPLRGLPSELARGALAVDGTSYVEVDLLGLLELLAERASLLQASPLTSEE
ncbi:chemotaxis protein CheW [uncultured Thiodictyon sp.]|uniref:chemotaxis protein CheW n=1 Tax=uncultured Thiodictyon sp. TaxID=1846217 RepID=UPI0025E2CF28|nr:chemotaxis protein CheW [uncultured Thiodictyon sp.]